ncbi:MULTISPECIES: helix-turn-helix transcriptional regulator [Marinomonas]|uniref:Helix-turn-helix domain-containing protein n=1 Tax=Marinomonas rhodophyticola TaxID=2992803 RepID=A0ABT3KJC7_9GAMM|nr:helix-turn-helix transcriptional regulator [Marinomonas sp. KJ51-3]MCW4630666.1 helix-turn-helix domain-containing protein [Marinomonas sp. KJ51-3]
MKMKEQLDSAQPLKKHKTKTKKSEHKKKQAKLDTKKESKEQKHHKENTSKKTSSANLPKKQYKIDSVVTKTEEAKSSNTLTRQRVSKNLQPMSKEDQLIAINQIIKRLLLDEMTQGEALRELRVDVLGLRQDAYTKLSGVSRKTLSEIENDKGNYTAEIINKVFKPFDIKLGLVPTSSQLLAAILTH